MDYRKERLWQDIEAGICGSGDNSGTHWKTLLALCRKMVCLSGRPTQLLSPGVIIVRLPDTSTSHCFSTYTSLSYPHLLFHNLNTSLYIPSFTELDRLCMIVFVKR